jgi:nucleoside-diphosphate-sugar epimerase
MTDDFLMRLAYEGRRVVVTGGLGFLGSNLAVALHELGADVTVIDALTPGCGGNLANLGPAQGSIRTVVADIADPAVVPLCLADVQVIFNLAAEIAHLPGTATAARDLGINVSSQLAFLGHCVQQAPGARVVYTSTRQVYGVPLYLPVDESHPLQPVDFNGVHKLAASQYHLLLTRLRQIDGVVLNLTNLYGPRMALNLSSQGFLARFLSLAMAGKPLQVFGDGKQRRDPLYVSDAVAAILWAGCRPLGEERVFNIGHSETFSLIEIARTLSRIAGLPEPQLCEFPESRKQIDIGDYVTDIRRAETILGWRARTSLEAGLRESLTYYRHGAHRDCHALTPGNFTKSVSAAQ